MTFVLHAHTCLINHFRNATLTEHTLLSTDCCLQTFRAPITAAGAGRSGFDPWWETAGVRTTADTHRSGHPQRAIDSANTVQKSGSAVAVHLHHPNTKQVLLRVPVREASGLAYECGLY